MATHARMYTDIDTIVHHATYILQLCARPTIKVCKNVFTIFQLFLNS